MIVVVTTKERDARTGREIVIASHGIDEESGNAVPLPNVRPEELGATFDPELGEYVVASEIAPPREQMR